MALKLRKDIKKSSYYVWFLGAKESKGLRGSDYIIPVIKHLEDREKDVEPFKVTLQVSHKGLKIIQNIVSPPPPGGGKNAKPKNETIKHFIPHNTITYVYQHDDVIACILLLFNPVTKCPLHVHAYRCDSLETASHLKQQLQILIDRPENQKKITEIENRLKPKMLENTNNHNHNNNNNSNNKMQQSKKFENNSIGSDAGASSSTRESESSEERFALENSRISNLYDSVAAELREKLGKKNSPILLPPRDYDTVHRQKGNLTGIELRRCLNTNIVGQNVIGKNKRIESSGGSSGIGSDHPPSPESPDTPENRYHTLETHSTSDDEDWNGDTADSTLYLINESHQVTLPRPLRNQTATTVSRNNISKEKEDDEEVHQRFSRYSHDELKFSKSLDDDYRKSNNVGKYLPDKSKQLKKQKSAIFEREMKEKEIFRKSLEKQLMTRANGGGGSKGMKYLQNSYDDQQQQREQDREREKYFYNEKQDRNGGMAHLNETYFEDDGFDENLRSRNNSTDFEKNRSYSYNNSNNNNNNNDDDEIFFEEQRIYPIPKTRQNNKESKSKDYNLKSLERNYNTAPPGGISGEPSLNRRQAKYRQRSPSPNEEAKEPKDRFLNAKEKFLLMEKERLTEEERRRGANVVPSSVEMPISPMIQKDKSHFIKRHQSMAYGTKNHLRNSYDDRYHQNHDFISTEEIHPKPAPRYFTEEPHYIREPKESFDRHRNLDKQDPKRRSMFSLIEEEHKKNSNEIARELKRRSYLDNASSGGGSGSGGGGGGFHSLNDDRGVDYPSQQPHYNGDYRSAGGSSSRGTDNRWSDRTYHDYNEDRHNSLNNFSKSSHNLDRISTSDHQKFLKNPQQILMKSIPGYRHSYAEPKMRIEPKKKNVILDSNNIMLHRNNSSVGYMHPRVGIASIQHNPYTIKF